MSVSLPEEAYKGEIGRKGPLMDDVARNIDIFQRLLRQRMHDFEKSRHIDQEITASFAGQYAVLVLDSSSFTSNVIRFGIIHSYSLVIAMRDLLTPSMVKHGALHFWYEADNIFAVFNDPISAVRCAEGMQEVAYKSKTDPEMTPCLGICIGIGYGQLLNLGERHLYGLEMNFASKLGEDVAGPGEILLTESAATVIREEYPQWKYELRGIDISGFQLSYYRVWPALSP